jgi:uncharacterized protein YjbJ (UPF0337 family)
LQLQYDNQKQKEIVMNKNVAEGNWEELKGKVRQAWAKLTDDDVERVKGNWEELSGRVQRAYGCTKEKAWDEVEQFKAKHSKKSDGDCCGGHH